MARDYAKKIALVGLAAVFAAAFAEARSIDAIGETVATAKAAVNAYRSEREAEIILDFVELLALPNVADNLPDMERNADHIIGLLEPRGFKTRRLHAGGAPYIYAELLVPGATETIVIYAHFDGQPVQEENWAYPPFTDVKLPAKRTKWAWKIPPWT